MTQVQFPSRRLPARQREYECAALDTVAMRDEISVHQTREITYDREPQADAMLALVHQVPVQVDERLDCAIQLIRRDAATGVGVRQLHHIGRMIRFVRQRHVPTQRHELDRIRQHVEQDLSHLLEVRARSHCGRDTR